MIVAVGFHRVGSKCSVIRPKMAMPAPRKMSAERRGALAQATQLFLKIAGSPLSRLSIVRVVTRPKARFFGTKATISGALDAETMIAFHGEDQI
jgi:hypothetical protein